MIRIVDMTGKRIGRLVVIQRVENNKRHDACWMVKCDCGVVKTVAGRNLRSGRTTSCGCLIKEITSSRCRQLTGPKAYRWNGGRVKIKTGYIYVKSSSHPAANQEGYVFEHRLVMEKCWVGSYYNTKPFTIRTAYEMTTEKII